MDIPKIDKFIKNVKLWIQQNKPPREKREDKSIPIIKGKFYITPSGVVVPLDDTAKRELEKK